ncbi:MAG: hypothetical protein LBM73_03485 [Candidatus Nomurabacteria bacterium]|jgi:hypothetical protein|nr:hypothetical protein [Candidatus Nomurabacteria bacterium]
MPSISEKHPIVIAVAAGFALVGAGMALQPAVSGHENSIGIETDRFAAEHAIKKAGFTAVYLANVEKVFPNYDAVRQIQKPGQNQDPIFSHDLDKVYLSRCGLESVALFVANIPVEQGEIGAVVELPGDSSPVGSQDPSQDSATDAPVVCKDDHVIFRASRYGETDPFTPGDEVGTVIYPGGWQSVINQ